MANVLGGKLAAETCRAGALGFLAAGHLTSLDGLEKEIQVFRQTAPKDSPLCIGFIGHSSLKDASAWDRVQTVLDTHQPEVVQFFAPSLAVDPTGRTNNIEVAQKAGAKVLAQVCSVSEARMALEGGADGLIVQGSEAGGHGFRRELGSGTLALSARIASIAAKDTPILAAGGIVDGRGLVAALALGCDGVVLGTRLWASLETLGPASFRERLASPESQPDAVVRTTVVDQIYNSYAPTPWPAPYDSVGMIRNDTSDRWDGRTADLAAAMEAQNVAAEYQDAVRSGDPDIAAVLCGEGVGDIHSIDKAYDILNNINNEAVSILQGLSHKHLTE